MLLFFCYSQRARFGEPCKFLPVRHAFACFISTVSRVRVDHCALLHKAELRWSIIENNQLAFKNCKFFLLQVQNDPSTGANRSSTNASGGRYTPLSALASLQPGGTNAAAAASGPRFPPSAASAGPQASTTFQHFASQGKLTN